MNGENAQVKLKCVNLIFAIQNHEYKQISNSFSNIDNILVVVECRTSQDCRDPLFPICENNKCTGNFYNF